MSLMYPTTYNPNPKTPGHPKTTLDMCSFLIGTIFFLKVTKQTLKYEYTTHITFYRVETALQVCALQR